MLNMVEPRVLARAWQEWDPQVMYVHHQSSPFPTRTWLPPFRRTDRDLHTTLMSRTVNTVGMTMARGLSMLVIAQDLYDILQFSLQKPVEQVSLLPLPGRVKSVALATLGGVLRPLSKASARGGALAVVARSELLPITTVAAALVALLTYAKHRRRHMTALEGALARHAVDFSQLEHMPLVVDAGTVSIIDNGLANNDPGVVVFAASLLEQLRAELVTAGDESAELEQHNAGR